MGTQLEEFYRKAAEMGQLKAKMRLVMLTLVPSTKASEEPDSPELLKKFQDAFTELEKEFK